LSPEQLAEASTAMSGSRVRELGRIDIVTSKPPEKKSGYSVVPPKKRNAPVFCGKRVAFFTQLLRSGCN
jgi:hypothetical protein